MSDEKLHQDGRQESSLASASVPLSGQISALKHLREYEDPAALERTWNRLQFRRRRSLVSPVARVLAAAALLTVGVGVGVMIERSRLSGAPEEWVSSEVLQASAPAGPVTEAQLRRSRSTDSEDATKKTPRGRVKRTARRLAVPFKTGLEDGESLDEEVLEELPLLEEDSPPSKPEWLLLADRGDYTSAFQKLDESGGFDAVLSSGSSEELMTLVDIARVVGRQGRAIQALRVVTEHHQGDANAPLAAMILGNLLSRAGDPAGAAQAYALNRRLSPGGDFAEDALVREFDMASADGDLGRVEQLRRQYETEFPEGKHLEDMRAEESRLRELTGVLESVIEQSAIEQSVVEQSNVEPASGVEGAERKGTASSKSERRGSSQETPQRNPYAPRKETGSGDEDSELAPDSPAPQSDSPAPQSDSPAPQSDRPSDESE